MRDSKLKYDIIEKQAYALIQALKSFSMYVLHSPITAYVPNSVVKIVLTQPNTDGKRGRWITQILEFDLNIKIIKLVKGQGLAKILAESNYKVLGINSVLEIQGENPQEPTQILSNENPQEPSQNLNEENPQEPPHHPEEKNPQEPLPSYQTISLHIDEKFLFSNWYKDIVNFLVHFECPASFSKSKCKALKLKAVKYCIINENLY